MTQTRRSARSTRSTRSTRSSRLVAQNKLSTKSSKTHKAIVSAIQPLPIPITPTKRRTTTPTTSKDHKNKKTRRNKIVHTPKAKKTLQSVPIVTPSATPILPVSLSSVLTSPTSSINHNDSDDKAPPVDQDIDLFSKINTSKSYNVVKDENGEWYDVVLNQCNITYGNNNNKYYRLQLIQHKISKGFYVWMKWGRVGERPKANTKSLKGPFATEDKAFNIFAKKYTDKTGNWWGDAEFVPCTNKYTRIEIDNNVEVNDDFKTDHVKKEQIEYLPSDLDVKTKELIEVLFSKDMRDEALSTFNLDLKRLPLGVPSQQQIEVGISVLNEIEDKINGGGSRRSSSFDELSSKFYTAIPHSFGRQRPPVIKTTASLQQRYDMCNILMDMYSTNETIRKLEEEEAKVDVKKVPSPVDSHYKSLNADLSVMKKNTDEFQKIQKYFDNTKGSHSSAKLIDAWKVDRHGEDDRFKKFNEVDNRKLLWHGTNIAVVAPILTSGLRIMPHSGGRVGAGIYLASMQEKSAQYTSGYGSKFACMFLCEAPLGKSHKITSDGHHASSLKTAPNGYDSVHAIGMTAPKSWGSISLDGNDVNVPDSNAIQTDAKSSFWHDEYLVYDESQVRIRYVLTVKLY